MDRVLQLTFAIGRFIEMQTINLSEVLCRWNDKPEGGEDYHMLLVARIGMGNIALKRASKK